MTEGTFIGRLVGMGTLFLSGPIYQQRTSSGETQYVLPMVQRDGVGVMSMVGIWVGPAAESFMALHRADCRPGKALDITFERLFAHNNVMHGIVSAAVLAPDRWAGHVKTAHPPKTTNPASHQGDATTQEADAP